MICDKAKAALMLAAALLSVFCVFTTTAPTLAAEESCVGCHTNAELLKSMIPEDESSQEETGET